MVSSAAKTVDAYLDELPPARRVVVATVRNLVNANLPPDSPDAEIGLRRLR